MKKLFTLFFIIFLFSYSQTPLIGLVLEEIDNGGLVPGSTIRLYAEISEGLVYSIWADESNPHLIETTTTFFNTNLFGIEANFNMKLILVLLVFYLILSGIHGLL